MKPDLPAGWGFRPHSRRKFMRRLIVQSLLANRAVLALPAATLRRDVRDTYGVKHSLAWKAVQEARLAL